MTIHPGKAGLALALGILALVLTAAGSPLSAQQAVPQPIRATIDVSRTGPPISPLLYGQFTENLGNAGESYWEGGVWAELLGDRKFFYPVNNDSVQSPPNSRRAYVNRWWVVGPVSAVAMDNVRKFVGEHSPRVTLAGAERRGIRQDVGVRAGKAYSGRIILAGDPGARVEVALIWGPGPRDRQTVTIPTLARDFTRYPLAFTGGGNNPKGSIEIVATGTGVFLVGAVSLMPADNIEGWDRQVVDILHQTHPTLLRWGGNFSSNYDWRDGTGDPDKRPPQYDYAWDGLEPNDVGTFDVLALNRILGSQPDIGVNAGLGDARSAAEWVEYVNGSTSTPMGRLRVEHGHPEPFNVKLWGIGNEMYSRSQLGHMSIDHYVLKHNMFAKAMRERDPSILFVASGATLYQISADSRGRPFSDQRGQAAFPPYPVGSTYDWSAQLLANSGTNINFLAEHIYGTGNFGYDPATKTWPAVTLSVEDRLRKVPNRMRGAYEMFQEYRGRFPWLDSSGIRIAMDEWSGGGGDTFRGLWAGLGLNEMFRHTDTFGMSAHTSIRTLFNHDRYNDPQIRFPGLSFKLYSEHFGTIPILDIGGNSPQPTLPGTPGVDRPNVSSGSPTYPLDVMAALSADRSRITIAVVNQSEKPQQLQLAVTGATLPATGQRWTASAPNVDAANIAGQPPQILETSGAVTNSSGTQTIVPLSVNIFEFQIR